MSGKKAQLPAGQAPKLPATAQVSPGQVPGAKTIGTPPGQTAGAYRAPPLKPPQPQTQRPTPGALPGQLALLAQQLHQGFPSMPEQQLLAQMQQTHQPVYGPDPAVAAAIRQTGLASSAPMAGTAAAALGQGSAVQPRGFGRGMINTPGDLFALINAQKQRQAGK